MSSPKPAAELPLQRYVLFQTNDLDEARERVAAIFCPHRLEIVGRGGLDTRHHHLKGERLSLNYIDYGAKTLIAPGFLRDFYLFQMPVAGAAAICNGPDQYIADPRRASLLNPHLPTTMIWGEGCRKILVRVERAALEKQLAALLGRRPKAPLTFSGSLDLTSPPGAALRGLILHLVAEADAGRALLGPDSLLGRQIESALMTGLLEAYPNSYSAALSGQRAADLAPRLVRRAEEFMQAHLDRPLAVEDLAAAVGVSVRSLQMAFLKFRGTSPMATLRALRLARAHADLQNPKSGDTVTTIATRWGFLHFGRFAALYRARYGQSPSETLRAARSEAFEG